MTDPYCGPDRRHTDTAWIELSNRLGALHSDVGEVKAGLAEFRDGMKELSAAVLKLALVEERQAQAMQAMERIFKGLEKLEQKVDSHNVRLTELEKAEPAQTRTSEWVDRMVWAAAAGAAMLVASKLGMMG
jgi:chromosome segregation ATPase